MMNSELTPNRLDLALALFLSKRCGLSGGRQIAFQQLVTELCYQLNHGHSCIRVDDADQELLRSSKLVSENSRTPLILEKDRLYFHRYWRYETELAEKVRGLAIKKEDLTGLDSSLNRYFQQSRQEIDWQRLAAEKAAVQNLTIISGGPGTGKTTTVVKIIAILLEILPRTPQIALAAPTGKAAMRLQQSIVQSKSSLNCDAALRVGIPERVFTLHRLLGAQPKSPLFRHNESNPLPYDLIIVDEASMVDLALMCKLTDALKPGGRLILLGDKDQLASVESGAVLADLSAALPENTCELKKSFRFEENIKLLAEAINYQRSDDAWNLLLDEGKPDIGLISDKGLEYIVDKQSEYLRFIAADETFERIFQAFNTFQALCAIRKGANSVEEVNREVERRLFLRNEIVMSGPWYIGRPVMITQNDPELNLYNGDIGICLQDKQTGKRMVFFPGGESGARKFIPSRLPHCETVFAMTVHKSQGSEFDEVLILLPDRFYPLLTKELLYTAVTRARKKVYIKSGREILVKTVEKKVDRYGGLQERLSNNR